MEENAAGECAPKSDRNREEQERNLEEIDTIQCKTLYKEFLSIFKF